ncbi:hypothetical protein KJ786_01400 [Patescibacteria group bacterium]|nr:hypothetical protein [Patescibacteria group bacterium]
MVPKNNSIIFKKSERGVSILIVFFVMVIILAIVLGINVIILSEMKVIREMGYSVIAFSAGDAGLEKTLYYDRKIIPTGGIRGVCNICVSCGAADCINCTKVGANCSPITCTDCKIIYTSQINNKSFRVVSTISTLSDTFQSYGSYMNISRAVELNGGDKGGSPHNQAPIIIITSVTPRSVPSGIELMISANIFDPDGAVDPDSVIAHIQNPNETDIDTIFLTDAGSNNYVGYWTGPIGVYYIDITACDTEGNCSEAEDI